MNLKFYIIAPYCLGVIPSKRTEYPIDSPNCSHRSFATRSANVIAEILRG